MTLPRQKEDFTTEMFAALLRSDVEILRLFLRFLFRDPNKVEALAALPLRVETQHPIPNGRFDLLIHHQSVAIIVECKVNAGQQVYQLEKYHKHWLTTHKLPPYVFWLVRRKTESRGLNTYLTAEMQWDELYAFFQNSQVTGSATTRKNIVTFCNYLSEADILLKPTEKSVRTIRKRGYEYQFAENLLHDVARGFEDSEFEVTPPMNGVTHRLFIGRKCWLSKFADGWVQRVVLQFKPDKPSGGFFWHGNIMLYNRHNVADPTFAISKMTKWGAVCKTAGFRLLRNMAGNWNGNYSYEVQPPYIINRPVKYFHAPLPDATWPVTIFHVGDEQKALVEGTRIIQCMYEVVDKF